LIFIRSNDLRLDIGPPADVFYGPARLLL